MMMGIVITKVQRKPIGHRVFQRMHVAECMRLFPNRVTAIRDLDVVLHDGVGTIIVLQPVHEA